MPNPQLSYEVEIRFRFDDYESACEKIPFLDESVKTVDWWITTMYGPELFRSDRMLRVSDVVYENQQKKRYLGWKGPDIGDFANIRSEIDEDITEGIGNSLVLSKIGGTEGYLSSDGIIQELIRLGYGEFMSFTGKNTLGRYGPLNIGLKLMLCPRLKYPLIVEIEKIATDEDQARQHEKQLFELTSDLRLQEYLVKEEPTHLLYESINGRS